MWRIFEGLAKCAERLNTLGKLDDQGKSANGSSGGLHDCQQRVKTKAQGRKKRTKSNALVVSETSTVESISTSVPEGVVVRE